MAGCPAPVVAAVQGAAYGGGFGLVCAADLAVAATGTQFSLSEARLGLVPAVIGPYVVRALGPREAAARMLLAAPFGAEDALRLGLVQQVVGPAELDAAVESTVGLLLKSPPGALAAIKRLVGDVVGRDPGEVRAAMVALIAERRASAEGQEGMAAFLAKRAASWVPEPGA
jgi:methylglutaconyl-CoA hydratase